MPFYFLLFNARYNIDNNNINNMELSNFLAEVWGISIVAISLSLIIKEKYIKRLFAAIEEEGIMFSWGMMILIIGVAMVVSHNVWVKNWQVAVTILGWMSLIKGLSLLFLPELVKNWTNKIKNAQWLPIAFVVITFLGLTFTYLGFTA